MNISKSCSSFNPFVLARKVSLPESREPLPRRVFQVKCGLCHELLLRGQKEIHEKQCQGPNNNPKARTRLCMPVVHTHAEVNPGMRNHAIKSGRREISAVYPPTRENTAPASGAHNAPLLDRNKDIGTNCAPGKDNNLQGGRRGFISSAPLQIIVLSWCTIGTVVLVAFKQRSDVCARSRGSVFPCWQIDG